MIYQYNLPSRPGSYHPEAYRPPKPWPAWCAQYDGTISRAKNLLVLGPHRSGKTTLATYAADRLWGPGAWSYWTEQDLASDQRELWTLTQISTRDSGMEPYTAYKDWERGYIGLRTIPCLVLDDLCFTTNGTTRSLLKELLREREAYATVYVSTPFEFDNVLGPWEKAYLKDICTPLVTQ